MNPRSKKSAPAPVNRSRRLKKDYTNAGLACYLEALFAGNDTGGLSSVLAQA